jgi:hypothetical protein
LSTSRNEGIEEVVLLGFEFNNKRLMKLHEGIEEMKLLTWLNVGGCDLDCFLEGMGQLEKMFELMLKDKKILVKSSKCIKKMKSLIMVDVGGC